jgi:uncharacterized protein YjiS (DUF1127 family)
MAYTATNNDRLVRLPALATSAAPDRSGSPQGFLIRLFDALGAWHDRASERRRLAGLNDRMLHDIGVDRAAAQSEAFKRFWQD